MTWKPLVVLVVAVLAAVALSTSAQVPGGGEGCADAYKWHRQQAMRYTLQADQDYHLKAAEAAEKLDGKGQPCTGWNDDAQPRAANGAVVQP